MPHPIIIQGGMGVAVSNWRLAGAVAQTGQLGVVSGTLLAAVVSRRLQDGDPDGLIRHALSQFPFPEIAERLIAQHYIPGGKPPDTPYKLSTLPTVQLNLGLTELVVAANFVEVFLAKEGHHGQVGINLLEKIQLVTLASLYGAMLANVDYVLMGAGIPRSIPGVLDRLAKGESASLRIEVQNDTGKEPYDSTFAPHLFCRGAVPRLNRPHFLAIVSSAALATTLARKSNGRVDGFVIETETAGGHNAPPRGAPELSPQGEPVYGPRDTPDLEKFRALGLPFWLAGSYGQPGKLAEALRLGAQGIQVGTAFAFCQESGIEPGLKERILRHCRTDTPHVFTDPIASPTGFPFKVLQVPGTLSDPQIYEQRERICDLGYLRQPIETAQGKVLYRCPAEPVDDYARKGGKPEDTVGRKCLCNALLAMVGYPQTRASGELELPIVTAGNDVAYLSHFLSPHSDSYSARQVIFHLLEEIE